MFCMTSATKFPFHFHRGRILFTVCIPHNFGRGAFLPFAFHMLSAHEKSTLFPSGQRVSIPLRSTYFPPQKYCRNSTQGLTTHRLCSTKFPPHTYKSFTFSPDRKLSYMISTRNEAFKFTLDVRILRSCTTCFPPNSASPVYAPPRTTCCVYTRGR